MKLAHAVLIFGDGLIELLAHRRDEVRDEAQRGIVLDDGFFNPLGA